MSVQFLNDLWSPHATHFLFVNNATSHKNIAALTPETAFEQATNLAPQYDVYFAVAGFSELARDRTKNNVAHSRAFYIDIDIGKFGAASTLPECLDRIKQFLLSTSLPMPTHWVFSGHGLHLYWRLAEPIPAVQWHPIAAKLAAVAEGLQLGADPTVTTDIVRVLRVPGTLNHKDGKAKQVKLLKRYPHLINPADFSAQLDTALAKFNIKLNPPKAAPSHVNADLSTFGNGIDIDGLVVAGHCGQLAEMQRTKGLMPEPQWYACLGILAFCVNGPELAHEWSTGDQRYDPAEVDRKLNQIRSRTSGPTTCAKLTEANAVGCSGCPHHNRITSPLQLGQQFTPIDMDKLEIEIGGESVKAPEHVVCPTGFQLTKEGVVYGTGDATPEVLTPWRIFPFRYVQLEDNSYEFEFCVISPQGAAAVIRWTPEEFTTRLETSFIRAGLALHHGAVKLMTDYLRRYTTNLQRVIGPSRSYTQNGWTQDHGFVLGQTYYGPNKQHIVLPQTVMRGVDKAGSFEQWKDIMHAYDAPGNEPYQFAIGAAFGSVLMRFTGQEGLLVSLYSATGGEGKTTAMMAGDSVFGDPASLQIGMQDTFNAIRHRIATHGSLVVNLDEFSNRPGREIGELAYNITQGRDKRRLDVGGVEKQDPRTWSLIGCVSTNQSLLLKMAQVKGNIHAEAHRVFEFTVRNPGLIQPEEANQIFPLLKFHYGHAGPKYIQAVVNNQKLVMDMLINVRNGLDRALSTVPRERFWSAGTACVVTGLLIARQIGLVTWQVDRLQAWAWEQMQAMRRKVNDLSPTVTQILAAYLNEHIANRLVISGNDAAGGSAIDPNFRPREMIAYRVELHTGRLYADKQHFRKWLVERNHDYNWIVENLLQAGVLLSVDKHKNLGEGTDYISANTVCLEIDTTHEVLRASSAPSSRPQLTVINGSKA